MFSVSRPRSVSAYRGLSLQIAGQMADTDNRRDQNLKKKAAVASLSIAIGNRAKLGSACGICAAIGGSNDTKKELLKNVKITKSKLNLVFRLVRRHFVCR